MTPADQAQTPRRETVLTRLYDAPRELVFNTWIEPEHLVRWHSAGDGWTTPFAETDPRHGGAFRIGFASPDGKTDFVFEGTYDVVDRPERLAYTIADGRPVNVLFEDVDGKTRLTLTLTLEGMHSEEQQRHGWGLMLESLGEHVAINRRAVLKRTYDAPRELVWRAWTDPARLAAWWGPKHFTNPVCEADVRPGGELRIVMRAPDGSEYPMRGTFREVSPPERLVFTNVALDGEGEVMLQGYTIVTFEDRDGKTDLTVDTSAVGLVPISAQMLAGMNEGWAMSLEKLADLLAQG